MVYCNIVSSFYNIIDFIHVHSISSSYVPSCFIIKCCLIDSVKRPGSFSITYAIIPNHLFNHVEVPGTRVLFV
jgi:hypothetical protein